jgi:predicted ester cyclase
MEAVLEDRKAISRNSILWWDSNSQIDPDRIFAPGYVNRQEPIAATDGANDVTLDELREIVAGHHRAFPGTKVHFVMQVAENNRVATHWTFSVVHKGAYLGAVPTGKSIAWAGISIDEFGADGKITRSWVVWDKFTLFHALGLAG